MAIFGVGEQRAGDERAERGRQPRSLHDERHADNGKQRACCHGLAHTGRGDNPVEAAEQKASRYDHPDNGEDGEHAGAEIHGRLVRATGCEQRHQSDERDGR
jgi:hypothetical protein